MTADHLFPDAFYTESLPIWVHRLPSEAEQCLIDKVVHYKALSHMEHEFLIVYASHPSGSNIVLGLDRNADLPATSEQFSSSPPSSSSSSNEPVETSPHPAYDSVQISHDGTPDPILAHHGPSVPLSTISFTPSPSPPSSSYPHTPIDKDTLNRQERERGRNRHRPRPSLLHLSILLLTIHTHFPSYALLQFQCYFFARATCLTLIDHFCGAETVHAEGQRAATWRGVHVSLYSAGRAAFQNMLLLPLADFPVLLVPAGLFAMYSAVKLYDGNVVESEVDRRRISDEKIREHAIPHKYLEAWRSYMLTGRKVETSTL
ncbi:hypothetical protein BGW80DRAFT_1169008 [Lactifluus volemus]|nr:hypothetical protein BGW80DRAFT_1169008 [Lactifluus volemus]